jgi:hypothetical protein
MTQKKTKHLYKDVLHLKLYDEPYRAHKLEKCRKMGKFGQITDAQKISLR